MDIDHVRKREESHKRNQIIKSLLHYIKNSSTWPQIQNSEMQGADLDQLSDKVLT